MPRRFTGTYPPNWRELAKTVKDDCGWQCVRCGHSHDPSTGYTLTIHHLTGDKSNNAWWNLAPLCQRCHLHIQSKVVMERAWYLPHSEWFKPYVAGYYAAQHGLPTDKAFVLENLDALIALGQQAALSAHDLAQLEEAWPGNAYLESLPDGVDRFAQFGVEGLP